MKPTPLRALAVSRRGLLGGAGVVAATGAVAGGMWWAGRGAGLPGQEINDFVSIESDGTVVFACPAVEMGQGATTALPMVLAEEMGADLKRIRVVAARRDDRRYGNPEFDGRMVTADSKTTRGYFDLLRRAGAGARWALLDAARQLQGWTQDDMDIREHTVWHRPSGRHLDFSEIVARTHLSPPDQEHPALKSRQAYTIVGSSPPMRDTLAKVTGRHRYGIDRRSEDALVAVVSRAPHLGGRPIEVQESPARGLAGVVAVIKLDDGVAVVATNSWSALEGARRLNVAWSPPTSFSDGDCDAALDAALTSDQNRGVALATKGDVASALSSSSRRLVATYRAPHVSHLAMEPMNAEARGTTFGLGVDVRSSTQSMDLDMMHAARSWKTAPFLVATEAAPCGGAFGRRVVNDVVGDAARVAKAMGRPVHVVRPLTDELRRGQVRPAAVQTIEAGTDASGSLTAWRHTVASDSVLARQIPSTFEARGRLDNTATDGMRHPYRVGAERLTWIRHETPVSPGFLRGVAAGHTTWAIETMVDRIARVHDRDPLAWRLAHVDDRRGRAVLERVAERAGWGHPEAVVRGLALMAFRGAWVATIAIMTDEAQPRLARLCVAVDVGLAIHPENVRRQVEGATVFGLSMAMLERLTFAEGQAQIASVADYPVLRADALVPIDVEIVGNEAAERPEGAGEIGVPTVAPAIANAIAVRTGSWSDSLPLAFGVERSTDKQG